MNIYRNFTFIIISVLFIACDSDVAGLNENFPRIINLTEYEIIVNDDQSMFLSSHIEIVDSIAVIQEHEGKHKFIFIDLKKGEIIKKWGIKGRGPNEFNSFSNYSIKKGFLFFGDPKRKTMNKVSIKDILFKENPEIISKKPYPYTKAFRPSNLTLHKDKKLALGYFEKGRVGLLDKNNNILGTFEEYPFYNDNVANISNLFKGTIYQGRIVTNPTNEKFCIMNLSSDAFEIFELKNNQIKKLYTSEFVHQPKIVKKRKNVYLVKGESIAGLVDVSATEDNICFSYSNKTSREMMLNSNESNEILCFDWSGQKKIKYITPIPISRIAISKNYLYGIHYDNKNEKTQFVKFKI